MNESNKEKIVNNLQQAKQTGELKTEKIREIIRDAVSETITEVKAGRSEIASLVKETISAVTEMFQDRGGEIKEEITASVEGIVEGISKARREAIDKTQSEIKTLEAKVETEEEQLQQQIDYAIEDLQTTTKEESVDVKQAISEAVVNVVNSDEAALLQKRYAQLKAQLAIVQANLAARYSDGNLDVDRYLNDAKTWYERAKEDPEVFTGKVTTKQQEFEDKLSKAATATAKKEKQVKQLLLELAKSITHIFRDPQNKK